ncbi:WecB/TagA/CpsF family glycosyltransferase [Patescibacteria group bacterium]
MDKVNILHIPVVKTDIVSIIFQIKDWLRHNKQYHIVTMNPEIMMAAQDNKKLKKIFNNTINIPDGSGLLFAASYLKRPIPKRITGVDLVDKLLRNLKGNDQSVYLLGANHGIAEKVAIKYKKINPDLVISGVESGYRWWWRLSDNKIVNTIKSAKPKILLVAYGAPKQELWIDKNLPKLKSVKVSIGVGGTFDFLSGKVRRAPKIMRQLSLEWLWRVIMEPWRWPRIVNATWKFSKAVIKSRKT